MTRLLEIEPGLTAIDTGMFGRENVTSAYLLAADQPALVETGSANVAPAVQEGLSRLGVGPGDLAHVVVTHIHLDHAGGAGHIARMYPNATIWVHERGAAHLADPARLLDSAARIYGQDRLRELFGLLEPTPADRLRAIGDGDVIELGGRSLRTVYTPGHAGHHVALLDSGTGGIFVGDALGVFLPDVRVLRPATPPPEFDLDLAVASIERIAGLEPGRLLFSHFGPAAEVEHLCHLAIRRLRRWTAIVEEAMDESDELGSVMEALREGTRAELNPAGEQGREAISDRYELLSSYEMNTLGIMRYLRKRRESAEAAG